MTKLTALQQGQVSDSLRVSGLAFSETATSFISALKVADGASFLATLSGAVVFMTQWHLKDDKDPHHMQLSTIHDALKKEIADLFPKAKKYFGYQVIQDARELAKRLCYAKGNLQGKAQYGGAVHVVAEAHNPQSAMEGLKEWLATNEGIDGIWKLQHFTETRKKKGRDKDKATSASDPKLLGNLVDEMASVKVAIERTEDVAKKQDLIERASENIVLGMPDIEQGARALFMEAGHKDIETLERILKMGQAILDRMLEEKTENKPDTVKGGKGKDKNKESRVTVS